MSITYLFFFHAAITCITLSGLAFLSTIAAVFRTRTPYDDQVNADWCRRLLVYAVLLAITAGVFYVFVPSGLAVG